MPTAAIVVTYNRLTLLKECIEALRNQTRKPDLILVINNGSTDGTSDWLNEQFDITVVHQENTGGAGGFNSGLKEAYQKGYEWIWCMDDDTLPTADCLEEFMKALQTLQKTNENIGWVCSKVLWKDGSLAKMNGAQIFSWGEWLNNFNTTLSIPAKSCSFVSVMFNRNAIQKVGFPFKEYFMWLDDTEYTRRFYKYQQQNFLVLNSIAYHQTPENTDSNLSALNTTNRFKFYYGIRNTPSMLKNKSKNTIEYFLRICEYLIRSTSELYQGKKIKHMPWFFSTFLKGLSFQPKIERPENLSQ